MSTVDDVHMMREKRLTGDDEGEKEALHIRSTVSCTENIRSNRIVRNGSHAHA